jgi:hypothetical protein
MINGRFATDEEYHEPPADAYPMPDRPILVSQELIRSTIDSLERTEEFFRHHANPSTREALRAYAQTQGWHPATGPEAFLDGIAFAAHSLRLALTDREDTATRMT